MVKGFFLATFYLHNTLELSPKLMELSPKPMELTPKAWEIVSKRMQALSHAKEKA